MECQSAFCASGLCCDRACDGRNESCAIPGFQGSCLVLSLPATPTGGPAASPTSTTAPPASSPTPTAPAPTGTPTSSPLCIGDCNDSGEVAINELLTLVNIALGNAQPS